MTVAEKYKNINLDDNYRKFIDRYELRFNRRANLLFAGIDQNNYERLFEIYETVFLNYLYDKSTDARVPKDMADELLNNLDYKNTWIEIINVELEEFMGKSLFSQLGEAEKKR